MPKVNPGESEKDFVARCIPIVIKEGATKEQAAGKCFGIYRNAQKSKKKSCKTIEKVQRKTVRGYLSPSPGDISEKENDILAEVYAKAREDGYDKERASKIAWGAVNRYRNKSATKSIIYQLAKSAIDKIVEKRKGTQ